MEQTKESFVFYASFYEALQDLKDKERLKMYDAICELALKGKEEKMTGISKTIFTLIKPQILANQKRYENGKKGGRPKKITEDLKEERKDSFENKKTNGLKKIKSIDKTENKPNDNENVNENVNENDNENDNAFGYDKTAETLQNIIIETLGTTNLTVIKECLEYLDKLPLEVIEHALRKTARKGAKWDYAMSILDNYITEGLDTLTKVEAQEIAYKSKFEKKDNNKVIKSEDVEEIDISDLSEDKYLKLVRGEKVNAG